MKMLKISDLPTPPIEKIGFPWTLATEELPPQYFDENLPKISIITPTLNQGKYIEETIRSVLLQNYPKLEYIIVDGGSTDETLNIIKKYEAWITYWISEPDEGQSDAINKGLKQATGEVFNWLNSDDTYLPHALLTVGQYFLDKNLDVLCGREIQRTSGGNEWITNGTILRPSLEETIAWAFCNQPPTFTRLSIVKALGGLDNNLHFCMDAELWVHYLTRFGDKNVKKVDDVLNIFRVHAASKTSNLTQIYYRDRFNILLALGKSLKTVRFPSDFINDSPFFIPYFYRVYTYIEIIDEKKLAAYTTERLLTYHVQYMSWSSMFRFYFFILRLKLFGWQWRVYFVPFIKIKRLFLPV